MIFKRYYIKDSQNHIDKQEKEEQILASIADKFNSGYNKIIKEHIQKEKEKKIIKLTDLKENKKEDKRLRKIRTYYIPSFKNKLLYYHNGFYVYLPSGIRIERVSQGILGDKVLGRAFPGLNTIQILDTLYGLDLEEVKKHEINHITYPFLTEHQIRMKTRQELPFYTRYH